MSRVAWRGSAESIPVDALVRGVYASAGFDARFGPAPEDLIVGGDFGTRGAARRRIGGFAASPSIRRCASDTPTIFRAHHVPVEHALARALARGLHALRRDEPGLALGPDGKVLVLLSEASAGAATDRRLDALHVSLQQAPSGDAVALHRAVRRRVEDVLKQEAGRVPGLSSKAPSACPSSVRASSRSEVPRATTG
jgi:hypothetical protein